VLDLVALIAVVDDMARPVMVDDVADGVHVVEKANVEIDDRPIDINAIMYNTIWLLIEETIVSIERSGGGEMKLRDDDDSGRSQGTTLSLK
jgi:hypothetical protein